MNTENLSTLKIHKMTQSQYERELEAGRIDENALYLTPDEVIDLSNHVTFTELDTKLETKANVNHIHDDYATTIYVDEQISRIPTPDVSGQIAVHSSDITAHADIRWTIDVLESNVNNKLNNKANSSHTHTISNVTNLQSTLDTKVPTSRTINGKALTSNVTISASDLNVYTKSESDMKEAAHNTSSDAHSDIRILINDLTTRLNNFVDIDDATSSKLSEVITLIDENKDVLESITTSKVNVSDIVDNLITSSANKVLSANQGVVIKALIDELQEVLNTHTHDISDVTGLQTALDNKSSFGHKHTVSDITDLTASAIELNYMDGVTSNVQNQLNTKATTIYVDTAIQTAIGNAIAASY